jgi:DNA polymerase III subunit alpha
VRPTTDLPGMDDWAAVKAAGMVEGYREKVFKGGGGKIAFFDLEDTVGRVKVKVRDRQIQEYAHVLTAGEPVIVSGKLSFPQTSEDEPESDAPREPTLFLNEVRSLSEVIRAETRAITLRLREGRFRPELFPQLRTVLEASPGPCPVDLVLELAGDARAHLALPALRVEPSDAMLAGLERLFGEKVAELR